MARMLEKKPDSADRFPRRKTFTIIRGNCIKSTVMETIYPTLRNNITRQIMQILPSMENTPVNDENEIKVSPIDTNPCVVEALMVKNIEMA